MKLDWLADDFHDAGLTVIEHTGWKTRTMRPFSDYTPVGLIDHHTAGSSVLTNYPNPPYYSNTSLETKCNYTIRGDGVVVVLNAGWAHDSGYGDRKVLAAVQADLPAPPPTDTYNSAGNPAGSNPGLLMNRWYIDVEVQHLGNGSPIAPAQREALITSNAVVCGHMGWDPRFRLIGHRESTTRKIDPRWDGFTNPMPKIRTDTAIEAIREQLEEEIMTPAQEQKLDAVLAAVNATPGKVWATPISTGDYTRSTYQALFRTEQATQRIELGVAALDLEGVSEAELDERVADLAAQISAQPAAFIAKLKDAL